MSETRPEPKAPHHRRRSVLEVIEAHVGVAIGAIAVATVVLKLLAVSHGDPNSLGAILRYEGGPDLVLAAILSGAPNLLWLAVVWAIPHFGEAVRERDPLVVPSVNLLLVLILLAALVPARLLGIVGYYTVFWILSSTLWARWNEKRGKRSRQGGIGAASPQAYAVVFIFTGLFAWIVVAGSARMWLPLEEINRGAPKPIVGYVLDASEQALVILQERTRTVARVPLSSIKTRDFCQPADDPRTLVGRVLGYEKPKYPRCSRS